MPWQMPIQHAWQLHLVHQPQEHYKVIDALGCYRQFFFHAPQYARKFLFCLVHYANGEDICIKIPETHANIEIALLVNRLAQPFQMDRSYFDDSKLDGIIVLDIAQGAEGWIYKRSNIYLRTSLAGLEKELNSLLPEQVSLL